jgi:hypothetical protein
MVARALVRPLRRRGLADIKVCKRFSELGHLAPSPYPLPRRTPAAGRGSMILDRQHFLGAAQPRDNRSRQDIANCELQNAKCKLFELPPSNLQLSFCNLHFFSDTAHRLLLGCARSPRYRLPLTSHQHRIELP